MVGLIPKERTENRSIYLKVILIFTKLHRYRRRGYVFTSVSVEKTGSPIPNHIKAATFGKFKVWDRLE